MKSLETTTKGIVKDIKYRIADSKELIDFLESQQQKIDQLERENQQLKESEEREKKIAYSWWFNSPERLVKDFDEFYNQIKDELTNKTK